MQPAPGPLRPYAIALPGGVILKHNGNFLALSPDGDNLVYVGNEGGTVRLYQHPLDQLTAEPIPGTEDAHRPFFSPDSQWVGFSAGRNLRKVSLAEGDVLDLCKDCVSDQAAGDWGPDDTIIFSDYGSLWQIPAAGGEPRPVAAPDREKGETSYTRPEILPDGDAVLFEIRRGGEGVQDAGIAVLSLETPDDVRTVAEEGTDPLFAETGHVIYAVGDALLAVPFDPRALQVTGESRSILQGVLVFGAGAAQFSFSREGTLAYVPGNRRIDRRLVWVDREGEPQPVTDKLRDYDAPRLSPLGERVVAGVGSPENRDDVYILEIEQNTLPRLTFEGDINWMPIWAPDGMRVAYSSVRSASTAGLYIKASGFQWPGGGAASDEREHGIRQRLVTGRPGALVHGVTRRRCAQQHHGPPVWR